MKPSDFTQDEIDYIKRICLVINGQCLIKDETRIIVPLEKWQYQQRLKEELNHE